MESVPGRHHHQGNRRRTMDPYKLLSLVAHHQTEAYGQDLESIANKQEDNLQKKRDLRDLQKAIDKAMSDDVIEPGEINMLNAWMAELESAGVLQDAGNITAGMTADENGNYQLGNSEDATQRANKE